MFVTNHVLSGALIGRTLERRPVAAFVVGVASHLALDAVPHWGCDKQQPGGADKFLTAAKRDGLIGLTVMATATLFAAKQARTATVAAMAGAALLDLDKPLVYFFDWNPFPWAVRSFHERVQNESEGGLTNEIRFGVAFAAADALFRVLGRRRNPYRRSNSALATTG